ncbi:MAG TPA: hypothetical protein DEF45_04000 [Rhodopirellula sp.]|nr:hypothetical protein [Rhodopirellula sp.]
MLKPGENAVAFRCARFESIPAVGATDEFFHGCPTAALVPILKIQLSELPCWCLPGLFRIII